MTGPTGDVADLVTALLRGLPAADLAALVEGRARLAVVPVDTTPASPPSDRVGSRTRPAAAPAARAASPARHAARQARQAAPATGQAAPPARRATPVPDPARARAELAAMSRRDDGTAYLCGWTARDLRALAASLELRGVAGLRKADLVDRIVDRTIGFRLDSTAIRRL
ncbi:Rho termination factor N-terminal domain-containing protein [Micromonospora peucetia]|uniref:Rho termination factor N-terminal domain-containing protein n=1 Tax=Micromonospora peucetia TaxID=47871 RepID=UPI00224D936D|nr:Rho termination factor N-terminal domain-containing protein [Micromonospora peucetia]MCX4386447.1 Rho termination factor N-terminal domain-containing protein [Micromonospora peucetia]